MMSFKEFLTKHKDEDSVVGDFASDALADKGFPWEGITVQKIVGHLRSRSANPAAIYAAKVAWGRYVEFLWVV